MLEIVDSLLAISSRANRLKRRVRDLKDTYINERFRDDSIVQDLEQMGIRLAGMPEVSEPTIDSVTNADMMEILHRTFDHLARVAVFIDQARIGERIAFNEPISYERHFHQLENNNDHGIYWILCRLQQAVGQTRRPVPNDVIDAVLRMRVVEVDRNAMRHTRDYLVLRDFERILERIVVEFSSLGDHHRRRLLHLRRQRRPQNARYAGRRDWSFEEETNNNAGGGGGRYGMWTPGRWTKKSTATVRVPVNDWSFEGQEVVGNDEGDGGDTNGSGSGGDGVVT